MVDDDIMDEPVGQARLHMAAASKERRKHEAKAMAQRADSHRDMVKNAGVRTDDDIMDEAAGKARITLAAESKARKAREAQQIAHQNAMMKAKLNKVQAVTDDDLDDEAAAIKRKELAAESAARRLEEARQTANLNAVMKAKLSSTEQRTDDDLMDEAAGLFRLELAAVSEARRATEARQTADANAAIRERLRTTPARVLSPPRYKSEPPSEDDVAATLAAVSEARAAAARCRDTSARFLTQDQLNTRRRFASQSKRTGTPLIKATEPYKTHVGRRTAALYRQTPPPASVAPSSPTELEAGNTA